MEKIMVLVCIMSFTILGLSSAQEINHAAAVTLATAPAAAATPAAPAPTPGSLNLSGILDKAGQFNTFLSLLKSTQVGMQLQSQLNNSQQGITIFAPSDAAFAALKPGALNSITDQDKIALLQYHALPNYYTFGQFQTVSNPVRTMASGNGGPFGVNVTAFGNSVNVSTGLVNTPVNSAVYSQNPVAVYQVDKVLLPEEIFGVKPPAAAPTPEPGAPVSSPAVSPSGASTTGSSTSSACGSMAALAKGLYIVFLAAGALVLVISS